MKRFTQIILVLLILQGLAVQAQEFIVQDVLIEGSQRIDVEAVRALLQKTSGSVSKEEISKDVKSLYETGYFDQVKVSVVTKEMGGKAKQFIRYVLVEKPVVRKVFIKGNKGIEEGDLKDIIVFDARRFLDRAKVDNLIRQAVSLYQSRGYYDASFEYSVVPVGENQVDITFIVDEKKRYKIREVHVRGLKSIDEDDLLSVIQTRHYKWWSSWLMGTGRLNHEMVENDRSLMRQYFLDHGLLDATISEAIIEKRDGGLVISFDANEGNLYTLRKISASGDLLDASEEKTLDDLDSKLDKPFSASAIREDAFKISDKFGDIGYAFANVVPQTSVDKTNNTVDVEFVVSKGNPVTVNLIHVRGNHKTYDNVIRREVKIDEQDLYSGTKVKRSEELLRRLGYFEEVNISSAPVGEDKVDLTVNVKEGSTGSFSAGAGYSSSDGALFNTRVAENNFFGTGRKAVLNLDFGTERNYYVLSFEDRRLFDSYVAGGLDFLRTEREFKDFDRTLTGSALSLGYPLEEVFGSWGEDISVGAKYEYLEIDIGDVNPEDAADLVIESQGTSRASAITPRLVRNTIDNPLNPTKGSRQELSVELAGAGGNQDFYLLEAKNTIYTPIVQGEFGEFIFSLRTSLGYGESFDDDPFPLYRRFFPGGINSIRGFKTRSLGPKDSRGNEFGGSKEFVNNVELIFPLFQSAGVRGVVFYDLGEAFDDEETLDLAELRQAYGIGIRWSSPLGPIRIEFGFPINRKSGEDPIVPLFSFGAPL